MFLAHGPYQNLTPIVANGLVYASGPAGIAAYRPADGSVAWQYPIIDQSLFLPWPVLVSGVIYLAVNANISRNSNAVALRAGDGTVLWKHTAISPDFGPMLVDDEMVISNSNIAPVYALNASDGSQIWQSPYTPADNDGSRLR